MSRKTLYEMDDEELTMAKQGLMLLKKKAEDQGDTKKAEDISKLIAEIDEYMPQ